MHNTVEHHSGLESQHSLLCRAKKWEGSALGGKHDYLIFASVMKSFLVCKPRKITVMRSCTGFTPTA